MRDFESTSLPYHYPLSFPLCFLGNISKHNNKWQWKFNGTQDTLVTNEVERLRIKAKMMLSLIVHLSVFVNNFPKNLLRYLLRSLTEYLNLTFLRSFTHEMTFFNKLNYLK